MTTAPRRIGAIRLATSLSPALLCVWIAGAALAAAPMLSAPRTARIGHALIVRASGLVAGTYSLTLVLDMPAGSRIACVAHLGPARPAQGGRVTLSGRVPHRLACHESNGPVLGRPALAPGRYHVIVGVRTGPAGWDPSRSYLRRAIRVTR